MRCDVLRKINQSQRPPPHGDEDGEAHMTKIMMMSNMKYQLVQTIIFFSYIFIVAHISYKRSNRLTRWELHEVGETNEEYGITNIYFI